MVDRAARVTTTFHGLLAGIFQTDKEEVDLAQASNVRALLKTLCRSQERRQRIFDEQGNVRPEITILKNGRNILFLNGLDTELSAGDLVAVFPPTYGG
jgi:molybdopterin synthase sulfur carrier subunit